MIGSTALFPISKMEESEEVMMRILLTHQVRKAVVVYGISIASQPRDLAGFCLHTGELIYCFKASMSLHKYYRCLHKMMESTPPPLSMKPLEEG